MDPLDRNWHEVEALLTSQPRLKPFALLQHLQQRFNTTVDAGELLPVPDSLRRTLERRVQKWKLQHDVNREVIFPQVHHAGGVPKRVRSDSLSAAVNNLSAEKEFARQYQALLSHYGLKGHRINVRKPQENGDVESSNGHIKTAIDQALLLRGNRNFVSRTEYQEFIAKVFKQRNIKREMKLIEEVNQFAALPAQRVATFTCDNIRVKSDCIVRIKRSSYSVSSKYIGLTMEVRIHQDRVELLYSGERVEVMPRLCGKDKELIDFRHVIDSLVRKPGAFENYKYQHHLYPTTRFRMAYDLLLRQTTQASAIKQYLNILHAAKHATMNIAALPEQLKELRLPTIRELHWMTAQQAARDQWTHLQFLSELASKECESRQANRIVRLMKDANLLPSKTWQQFQWPRLPLHVTQDRWRISALQLTAGR